MKRRTVLLSFALLAWFVASCPAAAETRVQYFAVFVGGKKLGYLKHTRLAEAGKVTTTQEMVLKITRMNISMKLRQTEQTVESAAGRPLAFKSVQDFGIMAQTIEGTIGADGQIEATIVAGERKVKKTMPWPEGARMEEGLRQLAVKMGLKEGTKYKAKAFSPAMMQAFEADLAVGAKKDVDLLGRVVRLTEVKTVLTGPTGRIESTGYVDDDYNALKTQVPMLGMQMEMVVCGKTFALSKSDPLEFFDKIVAASPRPLPGLRKAKSATYHIEPTDKDAQLRFLRSPSQKVTPGQDGNTVVAIAPAAAAKGQALPYRGEDPAARKAMKPARYMECDAKEIVHLAKVAVAGSTDAAEAAGRIEAYVAKYIKNKNLSVGYATALEVAKSRQGDCTEHAVLAAAMCRAAGIPAQMVTGLAYVPRLGTKRDVFAPHAWFRAYVGGRWIDYDAALGGFDAGHIALAAGDGDPTEFFSVIRTMGYFRIARVTVVP